MTHAEIVAKHSLPDVVKSYGVELKKVGNNYQGKCPFHEDNKPSFSVYWKNGEYKFKCHGCSIQGTVIDFIQKQEGLTTKEVMEKLSGEKRNGFHRQSKPSLNGSRSAEKTEVKVEKDTPQKAVATYIYRDKTSQEVFRIVRYEPKTFRPWRLENGKWVKNLENVTRVLYNLPKVLMAKSPVWIVEGEKDADNLNKIGFVATTNVGGAEKWIKAYSESLKDKEIVLCGDNDDAGKKHIAKVLEEICRCVKNVRIVRIPEPHKDVSDFIAATGEKSAEELFNMMQAVPVLHEGVQVPTNSLSEIQSEYNNYSQNMKKSTYDIGTWLPSLRSQIKGLQPGELVTILAATGTGKTACLQNMAISAAPLPTLLFEMELPSTLLFERFVANACKISQNEVFETYKNGSTCDWQSTKKLDHIAVCDQSKLTTEDIERIILQSELKMGVRPVLVLIDYIGLVNGGTGSRYERTSRVAEDLRIIAKSTGTIIVVACQTGRKKEDDGPRVFLNDAKDSGSIENSSSLVLGAWRHVSAPNKMTIRVLKNTKGYTGKEVVCNFHGETMSITEDAGEVEV